MAMPNDTALLTLKARKALPKGLPVRIEYQSLMWLAQDCEATRDAVDGANGLTCNLEYSNALAALRQAALALARFH